jgi:aminoglycoside phosphotransferase (APT) family kinase protein
VPKPTVVASESRCLGYELLPGVAVFDLSHNERARVAADVGAQLGALLRTLHALPVDRVQALVERDDVRPEAFLAEAARNYERVEAEVPAQERAAIARFLDEEPPAPPEQLVFSHNDLGVEHVLVDPESFAVTGVIDWADAALTDAAYDFGLLFRDLGPTGLGASLAAYGGDGEIEPRARFFARCALLEDLAYGLDAGRPEYVANSIAALAWVFPG